MKKQKQSASIGIISLGCSKNLVDLQIAFEYLEKDGFRVGVPLAEADVIIVNTCAFITSAIEEAAANINMALELQANPELPCKAVVVMGCLPQRFREEVFEITPFDEPDSPRVSAILGVDELDFVAEVVKFALENPGQPYMVVEEGLPKRLFAPVAACGKRSYLTEGPFAYVKIAEGCRHACAFCAIPGIRGRLRSREIASVLEECRAAIKNGKRELVFVAQDVTAWGMDFGPARKLRLVDLLREVDKLEGDFRVRMLYGHPSTISDELLDFIADSKHVLPYFDIPIQHSDPEVLKAMHRADTAKLVCDMPERIRSRVPNAILRTTCMVGFPGEKKKNFENLLAFVEKARFDHLGTFVFEPQEGTPAYDFHGLPTQKVAEGRKEQVMLLQQKINEARLESLMGTESSVLLLAGPIEGAAEEKGGAWKAIAERQAPDDVDGYTYLKQVPKNAKVGDFLRVRFVGHDTYDLWAEACDCASGV